MNCRLSWKENEAGMGGGINKGLKVLTIINRRKPSRSAALMRQESRPEAEVSERA